MGLSTTLTACAVASQKRPQHDDLANEPASENKMIIKLCGLSTRETVAAAIETGADMIGLVFFPKSPRHVSLELAAALATPARGHCDVVALTVNADDKELAAIAEHVQPDWMQLHGQETPARCAEVRRMTGARTIKALAIAHPGEAAQAMADYADAADMLIFDAKPPAGAKDALPGGNGVTFDWSLLTDLPSGADAAPALDYLAAGGLTPDNVAAAIAETRCPGVDVSSGIETEPGRKDVNLIHAFVSAARGAAAELAMNPNRPASEKVA